MKYWPPDVKHLPINQGMPHGRWNYVNNNGIAYTYITGIYSSRKIEIVRSKIWINTQNLIFLQNFILKFFCNTNITAFIQYTIYILLHFNFRVQVHLRYPCEILFWLWRKIFNTIITYTAILYNSNILYCF